MEVLIGILFVVILIVALWPVIELVVGVGLLSLIVWAVSSCVIFLTLYAISVLKMEYLKARGNLSQVIEVDFNGSKLSWFIDETLIRGFADSTVMFFTSCAVAFASMVGLICILKNVGWFQIDLWQGGPWQIKVSGVTIQYVVSILSGISFIILIVSSYDKSIEIFEDWMVKRADALMSQIDKRVERIEDLHSLEDSINSEATEMEVTFPIDVQTEIQYFVNAHKMEILSDVTRLNEFISKKIKQATNDLAELQKKNDLYQSAMELYTETVHEVNKTGSISLIKELDYDYEGLTSTNLKSLISNKKWSEFNEVVNSIIDALERVSEKALKYQEAEYDIEAEDDYEGETDEERAYRILGVLSTASPKQIKKVYHALSHVYHEDKGIVEDDTHMKEINWAYDFLKDLKHFT